MCAMEILLFKVFHIATFAKIVFEKLAFNFVCFLTFLRHRLKFLNRSFLFYIFRLGFYEIKTLYIFTLCDWKWHFCRKSTYILFISTERHIFSRTSTITLSSKANTSIPFCTLINFFQTLWGENCSIEYGAAVNPDIHLKITYIN